MVGPAATLLLEAAEDREDIFHFCIRSIVTDAIFVITFVLPANQVSQQRQVMVKLRQVVLFLTLLCVSTKHCALCGLALREL